MRNIDVKLQPSKQFIALITLILIGSLLMIIYLPIMSGIKVLLLTVILCYGGYIFWRYGLLRHPKSLIGLRLDLDCNWLLYNKSHTLQGELCGDSTLTTWVCALGFKVRGQRLKYSCVVFNDAVGQETYRRLLTEVRG